MNTVILSQLLLLLLSFALAAFLWLMLLIARFYQKFSSDITRYRLFLVPAAAYGLAAIRYSSIDRIAGDPIADLLSAGGGILLGLLSLLLYRQMTHRRGAS